MLTVTFAVESVVADAVDDSALVSLVGVVVGVGVVVITVVVATGVVVSAAVPVMLVAADTAAVVEHCLMSF